MSHTHVRLHEIAWWFKWESGQINMQKGAFIVCVCHLLNVPFVWGCIQIIDLLWWIKFTCIWLVKMKSGENQEIPWYWSNSLPRNVTRDGRMFGFLGESWPSIFGSQNTSGIGEIRVNFVMWTAPQVDSAQAKGSRGSSPRKHTKEAKGPTRARNLNQPQTKENTVHNARWTGTNGKPDKLGANDQQSTGMNMRPNRQLVKFPMCFDYFSGHRRNQRKGKPYEGMDFSWFDPWQTVMLTSSSTWQDIIFTSCSHCLYSHCAQLLLRGIHQVFSRHLCSLRSYDWFLKDHNLMSWQRLKPWRRPQKSISKDLSKGFGFSVWRWLAWGYPLVI